MYFFVIAKLPVLSIAVMTYRYVYHLRIAYDDPANLLRTQRINVSMRPQRLTLVLFCTVSEIR